MKAAAVHGGAECQTPVVMVAMTFDTVVDALLDAFPELRPTHARQTRAGPEGAYVVFDDVVYPHLERLLDLGEASDDALRRLFTFIERLGMHEDTQLRWLVDETIMARLRSDPRRLERARPFMGAALLVLADRQRPSTQYPKRFWGTRGRYPPVP